MCSMQQSQWSSLSSRCLCLLPWKAAFSKPVAYIKLPTRLPASLPTSLPINLPIDLPSDLPIAPPTLTLLLQYTAVGVQRSVLSYIQGSGACMRYLRGELQQVCWLPLDCPL